MNRRDRQRDVGGPVMDLEGVDSTMRPLADRIVLHRHHDPEQDVEREQRHGCEPEVAGKVDCSHSGTRDAVSRSRSLAKGMSGLKKMPAEKPRRHFTYDPRASGVVPDMLR